MATILDLGFLEFFVPLFSFIFIFVILYALLQRSGLLGGKTALDFIVSLFVTILVVLNSEALELANFLSVWSIVIIIVLVFILLIFFAWAKDGDLGIPEGIELSKFAFWAFVIVLAIGLTQVFGPVLTPYAEGADPNKVVLRTLFHPRILGALIILLIVGNLAKVLKSGE